MDVIRSSCPLCYSILRQELRQFVLKKFLLTEADCPKDENLQVLAELSLAKSSGIHPSLVEEFDTAQSCSGVTSIMAKKVLLFMAIQRALDIELPALESAQIKSLEDLSCLIWSTMQKSSAWKGRLAPYDLFDQR